MNGPRNLFGGDSFYERMQHGPVVPPAPAVPAPVVPPPAPPLLSVAYPNFCTLSKPLMAAVPSLRAGGSALLVPPIKRGGQWFLHTRIPAGMGSSIPERGRSRFRTHPIARTHFERPVAQLAPRVAGTGKNALAAVGNTNVFKPLLHFRLGPEVPNQPGVYQLIPVRVAG